MAYESDAEPIKMGYIMDFRLPDAFPAERRAVLSLFALGGLGHREIAGIFGVPEGTVWSRLHAARRQLAGEIGRDRPGVASPT